ncbi:MAG: choice-of-anchor E domain-containing protein [Proteobacteria bacterium]|nr:choice-of-anchor E domain-containing protein [Pseudomonadota bacterium]
MNRHTLIGGCRRLASFSVAWLLLSCFGAAQADMVTYTDSTDAKGGLIELTRFDPSLGTLHRVEVTASFNFQQTVGGTSCPFLFAGCTKHAGGSLSTTTSVNLGTISINWHAFDARNISCDVPWNVACPLNLNISGGASDSATDVGTLALFMGTGNVTFSIGSANATLAQGSLASTMPTGDASFTVTYSYEAAPADPADPSTVPEPTTLALATLAAGLVVRRRMPGAAARITRRVPATSQGA